MTATDSGPPAALILDHKRVLNILPERGHVAFQHRLEQRAGVHDFNVGDPTEATRRR